MKVLVGIDGSAASCNALQFAIDDANLRKEPTAITLINVHSQPPSAIHLASYAGAVETYFAQLAEEELTAARELATRAKIQVTVEKRIGRVSETIARVASEGGYARIVLGTKGRTNTLNILLGSVPQQVAALAQCPVVLVPHVTD